MNDYELEFDEIPEPEPDYDAINHQKIVDGENPMYIFKITAIIDKELTNFEKLIRKIKEYERKNNDTN